MARYEHSDVTFDVPRDWNDRSVVAFAEPSKAGQRTAANVVLSRDTLPKGETLMSYADKQLVELAKGMNGFDLRKREQKKLGGRDAIELRFGWVGGNGPIEQRLTMVAGPKDKVLTFTTTVTRSEAGKFDAVFDRILASVKFP